jgi:SulP family sulfate permease
MTARGSPAPILGWLAGYSREWVRADLIAGLTTAAVVIPKAMAYAAIAGLPVQVGLYTALVPMVVYAVLGTSRPLSVSTTTTIAILSAAALGEVVGTQGPGALMAGAATLALLVGAMLVVAFVFRLGFVANFISEPVLTGFKAGIGLVIVVDQLPKVLGIHFDKGGFLQNVIAVLRHVPDASLPTVALAGITLLLIVGLERFAPRAPAPLVAVGIGILAMAVLGLDQLGVTTVGRVPSGLPGFTRPDLSLVLTMWPGALGIALMSFTETIAAGRAFRGTGEPRPAANTELLALGAANVLGGLFGAMPAGGGTSQTAVNRRAGARTQVAEVVTAAAAVATLLVLAPVIGLMPQATLGAVVIAYSIGLISVAEFRDILHVRTREFRWALVAFAGVVLLGTLRGIVVAVIMSLGALVRQANDPPVYVLGRKRGKDVFRPLSPEQPDDETFPGLLMLRTVGRIYFANAQRVGDKMWPLIEEAKPKVVVIDFSAVNDLEYTALKGLVEAEQQLRAAGIALWIAALNPEVRRVVEQSSLGRTLGRERMCFNLEDAVERFQRLPA